MHKSVLNCPRKICDKPNNVRYEQNFGVVILKGEQQVGLRGAKRAGCDTGLNKKYAFTLAEVLITLVVIGIIASLTVPAVYNKYLKEQTVIQLKKVYSDLGRAIAHSKAQNGDVCSWDFSLSEERFFNSYLTPFLRLSEKTVAESGITYLQSCGKQETGLLVMRNNGKIIELNSGVMFFLHNSSSYVDLNIKCFAVDINGYKKPNRFGRDLFFLCISKEKNTVIPHYVNDHESVFVTRTREELKNGTGTYNYNCNKTNGRGMWCGALIMRDGWQIKDDYPW